MEKKSTKVTMIVITVLWLGFLFGIIGYQPYMQKQTPKQEIKIEGGK